MLNIKRSSVLIAKIKQMTNCVQISVYILKEKWQTNDYGSEEPFNPNVTPLWEVGDSVAVITNVILQYLKKHSMYSHSHHSEN